MINVERCNRCGKFISVAQITGHDAVGGDYSWTLDPPDYKPVCYRCMGYKKTLGGYIKAVNGKVEIINITGFERTQP